MDTVNSRRVASRYSTESDRSRNVPLRWLPFNADLRREIESLLSHLRAVAQPDPERKEPDPGHEGIRELLTYLETFEVVSATRLEQSFMPSIDILKVRLSVNENAPAGKKGASGPRSEVEGVFLRQTIARGLPRMWPLLDQSKNFFAFLDAVPGALDMTMANAVEYGVFFASEVVTGGPGFPFIAYPTLELLPQEWRRADAVVRFEAWTRMDDAGDEAVSKEGDDAESGPAEDGFRVRPYYVSDPVIQAFRRQLNAAAGGWPAVTYDRNTDQFIFHTLIDYNDALIASTIRLDRASGEPVMLGDMPIAGKPGLAQKRARLPELDIRAGLQPFSHGQMTSGGRSPLEVSMKPAAAAEMLAKTGKLVGVRVTGSLSLPSASLPSIHIDNCMIDGDMSIRDAAVTHGPAYIRDTVIRGAVDLSGMQSKGALCFLRIHIGGKCSLIDLQLGGDIEITTGVFVGGDLDLSGSRVGGDVLLARVHVGGSIVKTGGRIGGMLRLGVDHGVVPIDHPAFVTCRDLSLVHCEAVGPLALCGVHLLGTLRLENCTFGAVIVEGQLVTGEPADLGDTAGCVGVLLESIVRNSIQINACMIRGELKLTSTRVDHSYAGGLYAIEVQNSRIGQLVLWDEALGEPRSANGLAEYMERFATARAVVSSDEVTLPEAWRFAPFKKMHPRAGWPVIVARLTAEEVARLGSRQDISARELMACQSAQHVFTTVAGDVRIALCEIRGDVCLSNLKAEGHLIVLDGTTVEGDLLANARPERYGLPHDGLLELRAARLDVEGSRIRSDVKLAGMHLTRRGERALGVTLSRVDGKMSLADVDHLGFAHDDAATRATIDGDLDVSWSAINQLILDGRTLGVEPAGSRGVRSPHRLAAERATIRKIDLLEPLPDTVDLSGAHVALWRFGKNDDEPLEQFREVLDRQKPFRRNVYEEVGSYLQNIGHEEDAKKIRRDLIAREHRETLANLREKQRAARGFVKTLKLVGARALGMVKALLSFINGLLTGNFTSILRPLVCWSILWAAAAVYFFAPTRIEIDSNRFHPDRDRICRTLSEWSWSDGFKFSARYVLPVIPSVGMEDLMAADEVAPPSSCPAAPHVAGWAWLDALRPNWIRPSTVATVARLLSWLLLSLVSGTIFAKMTESREQPEMRGAEQ